MSLYRQMDAVGVINAPSKEMDAMNLCYLVTVTFIGFCRESHGRSKAAAGPTSRRASLFH